jgi:hypothetical protein
VNDSNLRSNGQDANSKLTPAPPLEGRISGRCNTRCNTGARKGCKAAGLLANLKSDMLAHAATHSDSQNFKFSGFQHRALRSAIRESPRRTRRRQQPDPEWPHVSRRGPRRAPERGRHRPTPSAPRRPTMRPGGTVRGGSRTGPAPDRPAETPAQERPRRRPTDYRYSGPGTLFVPSRGHSPITNAPFTDTAPPQFRNFIPDTSVTLSRATQPTQYQPGLTRKSSS